MARILQAAKTITIPVFIATDIYQEEILIKHTDSSNS
jgi:hypothetical protein